MHDKIIATMLRGIAQTLLALASVLDGRAAPVAVAPVAARPSTGAALDRLARDAASERAAKVSKRKDYGGVVTVAAVRAAGYEDGDAATMARMERAARERIAAKAAYVAREAADKAERIARDATPI